MVPSRVSGGSKSLLILGTAARTNTPNYYNLNGVRGEIALGLRPMRPALAKLSAILDRNSRLSRPVRSSGRQAELATSHICHRGLALAWSNRSARRNIMILARFRRGLILGSALTLGVGLASWQNSALAGVSEQGHVKDVPSLTSDARASGAIVVAENDGDDNGDDKKYRKGKNANRDDDNRHGDGGGDNGHRNGNNGNWNDNGNWKKYGNKGDHDGHDDNGHRNGNNGNWNDNGNWKKYGNKGDHDGNDDNGHRNGNNGNWNDNGNWKKYGNKGDHNGDGNWGKNGYQHWSQNHKNYGNGWSGYNNNWNKNWDRRAYVRNWNPQPYYGEFIGGVFLGSILAANGIGVVPYAPEPYLCWYWADPYMIRGYWDYCY